MSFNCIIPGGQRCGSTYLSDLLSKFDVVKNPITINSEPKWFLKNLVQLGDRRLYMKKVFGAEEDEINAVYLEKSTSYLTNIDTPRIIKETLGNIPIIIIIRNPLARAISHYMFSRKNGLEDLNFDDAIYLDSTKRRYLKERVSVNPFSYIESGLYAEHLKNWLTYFPELKIVFLEELKKNPSTFLGICDYLGLDKESGRNYWHAQKVNQGSYLHSAIEKKELQYLQDKFLEPNKILESLIGRGLPTEWNSLPSFQNI